MLVLETDSLGAARESLGVLPLVAHEIIDFELIELRPFAAFGSPFTGPEPT